MLELRPNCETCDTDLPNGGPISYICTLECTFCADCTENNHNGTCPNCGGNLVLRPTRPAVYITKYPQSTKRVLKKA
ncbi:MAG: DUF1272 domain-containing protein [Sneathiella sp.]|nr:DUF1272 domain-containing protein [Sneathiella sp.]